MMFDKIELTAEGRYMMTETTRILLAAGSTTDGPDDERPIDHLLNVISSGLFFSNTLRYISFNELSDVRVRANQYMLLSALIQQLLTYGTKLTKRGIYLNLLGTAGLNATTFAIAEYSSGCLESFNSILNFQL